MYNDFDDKRILYRLYTSKEYRGQGHMKVMLQSITKTKRCELEVYTSNLPAIKLYTDLGFIVYKKLFDVDTQQNYYIMIKLQSNL